MLEEWKRREEEERRRKEKGEEEKANNPNLKGGEMARAQGVHSWQRHKITGSATLVRDKWSSVCTRSHKLASNVWNNREEKNERR